MMFVNDKGDWLMMQFKYSEVIDFAEKEFKKVSIYTKPKSSS